MVAAEPSNQTPQAAAAVSGSQPSLKRSARLAAAEAAAASDGPAMAADAAAEAEGAALIISKKSKRKTDFRSC